MRRVKFLRFLKVYGDVGMGVLLCLGMAYANAQSPEILQPGTTTQLDVTTSSEDCNTAATDAGGIAPKTACSADAGAADGPQLRILAASGLGSDPDNFFGQTVLSVATLSHAIQIPVPSSGPYSPVLPVQVATEVTWSGGTVVAGIDSTFAQVVATFQVRDITDATPEAPGPVVASDTFLFERTDADFDIIIPSGAEAIADYLNLINIVDISNSSGTDVTAFLKRGRTYRIELEAKCDVQVPVFGFGACLFSKDVLADLGLNLPTENGFPSLDNDGFSASDFTVTVGSDPVQDLFGTP